MRITLKTAKLQEMVSKAIKGASNNKMIPLTGLMLIRLDSNILTLVTTDATNYLYICEDKIEGENFYVVVRVETFAKLISRMTSENVSLELLDDKLSITGNGKYSIELPLDEEGQLIKYPDPVASSEISADDYTHTVQLSTLKVILSTCKAALATTLETPCYANYYVGKKVIATDTYKICGMDVSLIDNVSMLMSPEMMNLFDVVTDEKISVALVDEKLFFKTSNCIIYGTTPEGLEDYAFGAIDELLTEDFSSTCKLSKSDFLSLLDRLALFVGVYDKNGIYLTFTKNGVLVTSKQSNGSECIKYQDSKNFKDYTCCIDIEMLRSQIKAQSGDVIELWYGEDNAIKMVDGNVTQIVALIEDDRLEE